MNARLVKQSGRDVVIPLPTEKPRIIRHGGHEFALHDPGFAYVGRLQGCPDYQEYYDYFEAVPVAA